VEQTCSWRKQDNYKSNMRTAISTGPLPLAKYRGPSLRSG
jgi:hypothetical protein